MVSVILYLTLFPFDFLVDEATSWRDASLHLVEDDFVRNVLLFLPLGFGLAGWLRHRGRWLRLLIGTTAGLTLSLMVEGAQFYLPRNTSVWDLVANTMGATVGVLLFLRWGSRFETAVSSVWRRISSRQQAIFFLTLALLLWSSMWWRQELVRINNWDESYPLVVANELSGNRPWQGEVRLVQLADRALSPEQVAMLLADPTAAAVYGDALVGDYRLNGMDHTSDATAHLPGLHVQEKGDTVWLATAAPVAAWTQGVNRSSAFTISIVAAAAKSPQSGPARIVSVSIDPYHRNVTLGQEGDDLVVRIRTAFGGENGRKPELVIPDLFTDDEFHHVVVRYDQTAVSIYIDDISTKYVFTWSPANLLMWILSPVEATQFRPNAISTLIFNLIYYGTLSALLLAFLYHFSRSRQAPSTIAKQYRL